MLPVLHGPRDSLDVYRWLRSYDNITIWAGSPKLNEGRDLALATDFRSVLGEVLSKHIGVQDLHPVFPGFDSSPCKFPGLIRG